MKTLPPRARKAALLLHVAASVAWVGAVAVFLALAITGLVAGGGVLVRACYAVMGVVGWWVIVPLCLASLVTGLVSALGTPWGVFRHYWVIVKLAITVVATVVLLVHMQPIDRIARLAAGADWSSGVVPALRRQLVLEPAVALLALLAATALSVYKPPGRTGYHQTPGATRGGSESGAPLRG